MEKPTLWTIQLVHTDLSRFDAYLREEMALMTLASRLADPTMTTGWDTTNPHLYYYEWHLVSKERLPDVLWGVDKAPKLVIGWLTASDYIIGKLTVECGCTEEVKHVFNLLLDGIVTTFEETDDRPQKQIIDITLSQKQEVRRTVYSPKRSGHPGLECNRIAIQRLQEGQERAPNYQQWCNDYENEKGVSPDATPSGSAQLYKKNVWEKWKKLGGKN